MQSGCLWVVAQYDSKYTDRLTWSDNLKIYGIFFGRGSQVLNESFVLDKLQSAIAFHRTRKLSVFGRSVLINILFCARIWYVGTCIVFTDRFISFVERLLFRFLWQRSTEWVRRRTVILPVIMGGLGTTHLRSKLAALQCMQIARFL